MFAVRRSILGCNKGRMGKGSTCAQAVKRLLSSILMHKAAFQVENLKLYEKGQIQKDKLILI